MSLVHKIISAAPKSGVSIIKKRDDRDNEDDRRQTTGDKKIANSPFIGSSQLSVTNIEDGRQQTTALKKNRKRKDQKIEHSISQNKQKRSPNSAVMVELQQLSFPSTYFFHTNWLIRNDLIVSVNYDNSALRADESVFVIPATEIDFDETVRNLDDEKVRDLNYETADKLAELIDTSVIPGYWCIAVYAGVILGIGEFIELYSRWTSLGKNRLCYCHYRRIDYSVNDPSIIMTGRDIDTQNKDIVF